MWSWSARWVVLCLAFSACAKDAESEAGSSSAGTGNVNVGEPSDAGRGGPPGIGDPCLPPSEESPDYMGASLTQVALEGTDNCASALCLLNHFQGRVSCPYGQNVDSLELAPNDPQRCRMPFQDGSSEEEAVLVAVPPQLTGRPPSSAVYCSCRCAGADAAAEYCECPEGMECTSLVEDTSPYAGSYCVKAGTSFDANSSYGAPCGAGTPTETEICGEQNP